MNTRRDTTADCVSAKPECSGHKWRRAGCCNHDRKNAGEKSADESTAPGQGIAAADARNFKQAGKIESDGEDD